MSRLIAVPDHIAQARRIEGCTPPLPWASFADFFKSRVYDRTLIHRSFLIYCDDDPGVRYTYTYAQFGTVVQETAAFLHDRVGLRRGDRLATVLFNHDVTVILYFAAWLSGVTVVPINVEESPDKKRFILEHSEAVAVCCWHSNVEELKELQRDLPSLQQVIAVSKDGLLNTSEPRSKKAKSPSFPSGSLSHVAPLD